MLPLLRRTATHTLALVVDWVSAVAYWVIDKNIDYIFFSSLYALILHGYHLPWYWGFIAYLPAIAIHCLSHWRPRFVSWLVVNRALGAAFVVLAIFLSLWAMTFFPQYDWRHSGAIGLGLVANFVVLGAVSGFSFRVICRRAIQRVIVGMGLRRQKARLLAATSIVLVLCPLRPAHGPLLGYYVIGLLLGGGMDFVIRFKQRREARIERQARHLVHVLETSLLALTAREKQILSSFAAGQTSPVRTALSRGEIGNRHVATILAALVDRYEGKYADAVARLTSEIEDGIQMYRAEYLLLVALNYSDQGKDEAMRNALRQALMYRPGWGLARLTWALRSAENVDEGMRPAEAPLEECWEAIKDVASESEGTAVGDVLGAEPSYYWTFAQDVYGYCLFKAGRYRLARQMLAGCVLRDPDFASPFLHLGELLLTETKDKDGSENRRVSAAVCIGIAALLEGSRDSRISRRAAALTASL